ncbi:MAG: AMP-binding protein [Candidatus Eremiobacteraeota bacterium]|nr:AMP-binding protein [Candidatus Eremiobacteraeota bacterium]
MLQLREAATVHERRLSPLDFLERSAEVFRDKVAVIDGDVRRTYPQVLERVYRFAHVLHGFGVRDGERVAVLAKNESALLEAHYAVPLAGGVLCALNIRLVASEIAYIVEHCGAILVVYDEEFAPLLDGIPANVKRVSTLEYERALADADATPLENPVTDEDATITINYTSGTTGKPKGVMYTHRGAYQNALGEVFHANLRPESVYLWTLPMFHCNGWTYPWAVTAAGATHVCLPKVDPAAIFALVEDAAVTHFCGAPTVLIALANHPGASSFSHPVHVITAGAPPAPTTIAQMEALGATITQVYGLTETYGPVTVCAWQSQWDGLSIAERARQKAKQGVPFVTMGPRDVRVVSVDETCGYPETLVDVPADGATQGEIVMRGNNVMKGYFADPEATAKAFAGGYFHSGDIAVRHPDGYIEFRTARRTSSSAAARTSRPSRSNARSSSTTTCSNAPSSRSRTKSGAKSRRPS